MGKKVKSKKENKKIETPIYPVRGQRALKKVKIRQTPLGVSKSKKNHKANKPLAGQIFNGVKKIKVKVIGIGNGAGSIVSDIAPIIKRAKFLVANTDKSALLKLPKEIETFQFGQNLTKGLGTGMNVKLAEKAAYQEEEKIKKVLSDTDFCVFVSCLGGGIGSGACSVFVEMARKAGSVTYGIFTLPFNFEGERKMAIAKNALERLRPNLNAISIVPNERIFQMVDKKVPLRDALSQINEILAFSLGGLIELIYQPGLINIDFADLKTILAGRGSLVYLSKVEAEGEKRAERVLQGVISNPLYPYDISKAKRVLFDVFGPPNLALRELIKISQGIFQSVERDSKIIFGVSQRATEKIGISLLAVGCQSKDFPGLEKKKVKKFLEKPLEKPEILEKPKVKSQEKPKLELSKKNKVPALEQVKASQKTLKVKKSPQKEERETLKGKEKKEIEVPEKKEIRKNALQVQKAIEELEKEIRKKEEIWEIPAFLRRKSQ